MRCHCEITGNALPNNTRRKITRSLFARSTANSVVGEKTTNPAMMTDQGLVRYGTPEDIANAVAYLASDAARWVSGQVLSVDGGLCLYAY